MTVREIYDAIDRIAPFQTAMDFDNVGILIGDENADVTKTLLCLDVTPRVLREAKSIGVELIISHHPVIFNPLRTVRPQNIIYALVQSGIAVISAHTNLDMAYPYGVNDALCRKLGLQNVRGILKEGETDMLRTVAVVGGAGGRLCPCSAGKGRGRVRHRRSEAPRGHRGAAGGTGFV